MTTNARAKAHDWATSLATEPGPLWEDEKTLAEEYLKLEAEIVEANARAEMAEDECATLRHEFKMLQAGAVRMQAQLDEAEAALEDIADISMVDHTNGHQCMVAMRDQAHVASHALEKLRGDKPQAE